MPRTYFRPEGSVFGFIAFGENKANKVFVIHLLVLQKGHPIVAHNQEKQTNLLICLNGGCQLLFLDSRELSLFINEAYDGSESGSVKLGN